MEYNNKLYIVILNNPVSPVDYCPQKKSRYTILHQGRGFRNLSYFLLSNKLILRCFLKIVFDNTRLSGGGRLLQHLLA